MACVVMGDIDPPRHSVVVKPDQVNSLPSPVEHAWRIVERMSRMDQYDTIKDLVTGSRISVS